MTSSASGSPVSKGDAETDRIESVDRLARIYRTAAGIIVRKGFDATSMNDIASAVELTKAGLYHYVRGKRDLLFAIMQFAMDIVDQRVLEPAQSIRDPEERLRFILARHAGMTKYVKEITILAEETAALTEQHRQVIVQRKRRYFDFVRQTLQELKDEGKLRSYDVTVATLNILATVLGISRWYNPDGPLSSEDIARETASLLLDGLMRPKGGG